MLILLLLHLCRRLNLLHHVDFGRVHIVLRVFGADLRCTLIGHNLSSYLGCIVAVVALLSLPADRVIDLLPAPLRTLKVGGERTFIHFIRVIRRYLQLAFYGGLHCFFRRAIVDFFGIFVHVRRLVS